MKLLSQPSLLKQNKQRILLGLVLCLLLGGLLRFWRLSQNPPGLYWDEVSIGLNAKSILLTGKDEFGRSFPFWFEAFGEYKLPVYIYATSLSMWLFGVSDWAVRAPSALSGVLGILGMYQFVLNLSSISGWKQARIRALAAALLFAISPWSIQFSRAGFEANLALTLILFGMSFLLRGFYQHTRWFYPAGVSLLLAMATYNSARVFVPLMLVATSLIYSKKFLLHYKQILTAVVVVCLGLFPLVWPQFNLNGLVRAENTSIVGLTGPIQTLERFLYNYIAHFDTNYLFFHGDPIGRHSVRQLGMLYYFEIFLIPLGLWRLYQSHRAPKVLLFTWLVLAILPSALTKINPHALRSILMIPFWVLLSSIGLRVILEYILARKRLLVKIGLSSIIVGIAGYNIGLYLSEYYVRYKVSTTIDWANGNREAINYAEKIFQADKHSAIYITTELPLTYTAFYGDVELAQLHQLKDHNQKSKPQLGKYRYIDHPAEVTTDQAYIVIAPEWITPDESITYQQIKMANQDVRYNIWERDGTY